MWPNPQFPPDSVTFTEGILNGKLHFLGSVNGEQLYSSMVVVALIKSKNCSG